MKKEVSMARQTKKRMKFNLDGDDSDDANFNFLTHRGKKLEDMDDFKDKIQEDSDDVFDDKDLKKGNLNDEIVNELHFGGGPEDTANPNQKKSREERLKEIMEKSKAFKFYHQEIKMANAEYTRQLDDDWDDIADLLTFKNKNSDQVVPNTTEKDKEFDDLYTKLKTESGIQKIQPEAQNLTEK